MHPSFPRNALERRYFSRSDTHRACILCLIRAPHAEAIARLLRGIFLSRGLTELCLFLTLQPLWWSLSVCQVQATVLYLTMAIVATSIVQLQCIRTCLYTCKEA